jgi:hypothetical protein
VAARAGFDIPSVVGGAACRFSHEKARWEKARLGFMEEPTRGMRMHTHVKRHKKTSEVEQPTHESTEFLIRRYDERIACVLRVACSRREYANLWLIVTYLEGGSSDQRSVGL